MSSLLTLLLLVSLASTAAIADTKVSPLHIRWQDGILTISGDNLPGKEMKILYLEAYCRGNSHTTDWSGHTVIRHKTEMVSSNKQQTEIKLRDTLDDGVIVDHLIKARSDEVDFRLTARNPTGKPSEVQWAQPCIRVGEFTGTHNPTKADTYEYLRKSFIFLDGKVATMPARDWATEALYTPGQVWAAPGVSGSDVNPRPLNPNTPSNGLIGCFSADDKMIFATAWDPYQELFQGVITCLHSDFRIGGLKPGETKRIHGKIYFVSNDVPALLKTYKKDFPDHARNP